MTETTLAAGDLLTAIPSLWESAQIPLAIIAIFVGGVAGAFALVRGFGFLLPYYDYLEAVTRREDA